MATKTKAPPRNGLPEEEKCARCGGTASWTASTRGLCCDCEQEVSERERAERIARYDRGHFWTKRGA